MRDIATRVALYRDTLGFAVRHRETGFAILRRDAVDLHLWAASDEGWRTRQGAAVPLVSGAESFIAGTASCRVAVQGVDELHRVLNPRGSSIPTRRSGTSRTAPGSLACSIPAATRWPSLSAADRPERLY